MRAVYNFGKWWSKMKSSTGVDEVKMRYTVEREQRDLVIMRREVLVLLKQLRHRLLDHMMVS